MDIAKQYEKMRRLRDLAENPSASEHEAANARLRIKEIEDKIRKEGAAKKGADRIRDEKIREKDRQSISVGRFKIDAKKADTSYGFITEWPFGWHKKESIQVATVFLTNEKKIVLEWKCPGCKMHVERLITPKHRARLMKSPKGVESFIQDLKDGKLNQLCDDCWNRYQ